MEDIFSFNGYEQPLQIYAQKKTTKNGDFKGLEILLRTQSNDRDVLEIIEHFETLGDVHQLTLLLFQNVCEQLYSFHKKGIDISVSINISPITFSYVLVEDLLPVLKKYNLPANFMTLEITERQEIKKVCFPVLQELSRKGFLLAIDDFGANDFVDENTLEDMKRCGVKITEVKLDKILLKDFEKLNNIAKKLLNKGYVVTVEGVETERQLNLLQDGVQVQGYIYGKPKPLSVLLNEMFL